MNDFDTGPPFGFYLRHNGSCPESQIQCSPEAQWSDDYGEWFNCCPEDTVCVDNTCCPSTSGCINGIESDPHCANNETWDLYEQGGGFFCCEHGTIGYVNSGLSVGGEQASGVACAEHWMQGDNYNLLTALAKGTPSASPTPSSSASASASASATPTPDTADTSDSDSGPSKTAAIVGGVVGGVVGGLAGLALLIFLIWFLKKRRRQQGQAQTTALPTTADQNGSMPVNEHKGAFGELPDTHVRSELSGSPNEMAHELPAEPTR